MASEIRSYSVLASLHDEIATGHVWVSVDGWKPRTVGKITRYENGVATGMVYAECLTIDYGFRKEFLKLVKDRTDNAKKFSKMSALFAGREERMISMSRWHRNLLGIRESAYSDWTREPENPGLVSRESMRVEKVAFWESLWARLWIGYRHPQVAMRVSMALGFSSVLLGLYSVWSNVSHLYWALMVVAGYSILNIWFYFSEDHHR
jgi:hypothetical protein